MSSPGPGSDPRTYPSKSFINDPFRQVMVAKVLAEVGKEQLVHSFAWYPRQCPKTRQWFWLRRVILRKVSYYRCAWIGNTLWPAIGWNVREILPL